MPTSKSAGSLEQVILSEEAEVSEVLVNLITSFYHGVVLFDLLQKHKTLAKKKVLCKKWRNSDVVLRLKTSKHFQR